MNDLCCTVGHGANMSRLHKGTIYKGTTLLSGVRELIAIVAGNSCSKTQIQTVLHFKQVMKSIQSQK